MGDIATYQLEDNNLLLTSVLNGELKEDFTVKNNYIDDRDHVGYPQGKPWDILKSEPYIPVKDFQNIVDFTDPNNREY